MSIGLAIGQPAAGMLICLGALLSSVAVHTEPYPVRFKQMLTSAPIAVMGYMLGSLVSGHELWAILLGVIVAFASGIISGYGAAFSAGAMQMLVMMIVAAHIPHTGSIFLAPGFILVGTGFGVLLLAIEALFSRHHPQRATVATLLRALATLARTMTEPSDAGEHATHPAPIEVARQGVNDALLKTYAAVIDLRVHSDGRSDFADGHARILLAADQLATLLKSEAAHDGAELNAIATWLEAMAEAVLAGKPAPKPPVGMSHAGWLATRTGAVADAIWEPAVLDTHTLPSRGTAPRPASLRQFGETLADRLMPGQEIMMFSARLALCVFLAMVAEVVVPGQRSYWVPLTVAIVLKPDFGSVFVRAVLRSVGTAFGVVIAALVMTLIPKGGWLVLAVAVLSAVIPWAGLSSYALMSAFLTPMILILIDLIVPGPTADYGMQRLIDTLIGSGIVLLFGYLIWPRSLLPSMERSYSSVLAAVATYLRATSDRMQVTPHAADDVFFGTFKARIAVVRKLSDMRIRLQRSLGEPPPASVEAAAWLPLITGTERLCDRISRCALASAAAGQAWNPAEVERTVKLIEGLAESVTAGGQSNFAPNRPNTLPKKLQDAPLTLGDIQDDIVHLAHLVQRVWGEAAPGAASKEPKPVRVQA